MPRIAILSASVRTGRKSHRTALFLQRFIEGRKLAAVDLIDLAAYDFPIFHERLKNLDPKPPAAVEFAQRIVAADGVIIVTPELVHPMDPEEVPPLPGFDVTEPTDREFYLEGRLEGRPTVEHRSTVWPSLRRRYQAGGDSMISGPFGHGQ